MLRFIKFVLILAVVGALIKVATRSSMEKRTDQELPALIAKEQASLPRMLNENTRIDQITYDNKTLHYYASSLVTFERTPAEEAAVEQQMRARYCKNKILPKSNVSVEYAIKIPPRSLSDDVKTIAVTFHPNECNLDN